MGFLVGVGILTLIIGGSLLVGWISSLSDNDQATYFCASWITSTFIALILAFVLLKQSGGI